MARLRTSRRLLGGAVAAGVAGLLVILLVVPGGAPPTELDTWVFDTTAGWTAHAPWAIDIAAAIGVATDVGPSALLALIATMVLAARRAWVSALFVAVCGLAGLAMVETIKRAVGRLRPPGAEEFIDTGLDRSFPSGHASVGIYVYAALATLIVVAGTHHRRPLWIWVGRALFGFGIVIGASRIVLGVHWATDVMAGWALSALIVLVATIGIAPQGPTADLAERPGGGEPT